LQKLVYAGVVAGLGAGALFVAHSSRAADHIDSPTLMNNPMADIADVYAWMTPDATKVNLAMSVSPNDGSAGSSANHFGPTILYTFHVNSVPGLLMAGTETQVICKFDSDTAGSCWVGDKDYVTGDPSNPAGIASTSGKVRLFAGQRSDPFFFNLQGFRDAVSVVEAVANTLSFDAAGCPQLSDGQGSALRAKLTEGEQLTAAYPCATDSADCFAHLNVKMIVLQVDKSLLNINTQTTLSVWGSTNMVGQ
jgi:hypothetical protein